MMAKLNKFFLNLTLSLSAVFGLMIVDARSALAHGEDTEGPHGGYIRMPGNFHTELAPQRNKTIRLYILDFDFKNPTTKDVTVEMNWQKGSGKKGGGKKAQKSPITCTAIADYFQCDTDLSKYSVGDSIEVIVQVGKEKGAAVSYPFPFKR